MLHFYLYLFYLSEKGFLDFEKCSSSKKGSAVLFFRWQDKLEIFQLFSFCGTRMGSDLSLHDFLCTLCSCGK